MFYDPTIVRYTEPYMDDNDKKNTGGKYRIIPIFTKAATMAAASVVSEGIRKKRMRLDMRWGRSAQREAA